MRNPAQDFIRPDGSIDIVRAMAAGRRARSDAAHTAARHVADAVGIAPRAPKRRRFQW